jgi:hypothetical protein
VPHESRVCFRQVDSFASYSIPSSLIYFYGRLCSQFGTENGLQSLLVLSGVTTEEKLLSPENTITPDYYTDTINDFFAEVPAATEA